MTRRAQGGFTLIEVLIAMALLVIGMTSILSLFSVALALQSEAAERHDVAAAMPEVMRLVAEDLRGRAAGADSRALKGSRREIPIAAGSRYRCSYEVEAYPGDHDGRCLLARVRVFVAGARDDRAVDFGYLPVVLPSPNAALLRAGTKN